LVAQIIITIILALIQGIAEWLPISSTAHLKIAETFLGFQATPLFNIFLHLGTLSVVLFYFRRDIKTILKCLVRMDFHSEYGRFIPLIVVATIPTGIIGILYDKYLADSYQTFIIIGVTFIVGACLLTASKFSKESKTQISIRKALLMGTAQGAAIFPGLSRSGSTISTGLIQGVTREMVFKFSFLLSIPAILGDLVVEAYLQQGTFSQGVGVYPLDLAVGLIVTAIAGYLSILLVKRFVLTKRFHYFAFYTLPLGIVLIALALLFGLK
jgi:undecaprenyl-diphosphatase